MEDFRSKSCGDGRMQMESYHGGGGGPTSTGMQDLRCYSASYAYPPQAQMGNDPKFKKGKSTNGSLSKAWSFSDPELQRKKRVASYKVYAVEGKMKGSLKKSFRWLKDRMEFHALFLIALVAWIELELELEMEASIPNPKFWLLPVVHSSLPKLGFQRNCGVASGFKLMV
ncbi:hypothetical protein CK203_013636 [Vitis vinifera]|uniref:Uncharacterized protein n=1 Tax=Vitis vinifera TaxID=29760 RepID=A0A438J919_VITVI|nr:hypothetical protein CK203_013636 [Vitis vinifera]